jgi:hypothetical protein
VRSSVAIDSVACSTNFNPHAPLDFEFTAANDLAHHGRIDAPSAQFEVEDRPSTDR